jgi:hypothetical protein
MPERTLLGEGMLTWFRHERVSDRYGTVYLGVPFPEHWTEREKYLAPGPALFRPLATDGLEGAVGRLEAEVTESRQSDHIGDLFRGFVPPRGGLPVGSRRELLFTEVGVDGPARVPMVGLRPDEERSSDWLDPRALYDVHEQTVRLYFVPEEES